MSHVMLLAALEVSAASVAFTKTLPPCDRPDCPMCKARHEAIVRLIKAVGEVERLKAEEDQRVNELDLGFAILALGGKWVLDVSGLDDGTGLRVERTPDAQGRIVFTASLVKG